MTIERDIDRLAAALPGVVHVPGSPGWEDARAAWQLCADQYPSLVVTARKPADVAAAVRVARDNGMRIAVQNTGHGASVLGDLSDVILLRTGALQDLRVNRDARLLRVQAGVLWADAVRAAAAHGLVGLAGSAGDVGVVGYILSGGLSWLGRRYGFAANDVVAFQVVTADGELLWVDAEREPELFWALRGGGGDFAAVVAVEIRLHPAGRLGAGLLAWPQERSQEVASRYLEWVTTLPDEASSCLRLMNVPDAPDTPELVRGRDLVLVEVVHQGLDVDDLVAPLRALAPQIDTVGAAKPQDLLHLHMDPPVPVPAIGDGAVLERVDDNAVETLLRIVGPRTGSPLLSVELRHLGGALSRPHADGGCLSHIDGDFVLFAVGLGPEAAAADTLRRRISSLQEALSPWRATYDLANYRELPTEPARFFPPPTLSRLRSVKAKYDPHGRFVSRHPVDA